MKEIIAIIRMNKIQITKDVLAAAGFPAMTAHRVMGRGKQKGLMLEITAPIEFQGQGPAMKFIPKRLLMVTVEDKFVDKVVELIIAVNKTGNVGDGKIFVCPVEEAVRVRTGERGETALV